MHMICIMQVQWGMLDVVEYLVDNTSDSLEATPLHSACSSGHLDVVRFLIVEKKYNLERKDDTGKAPIHIAAEEGHHEIVQVLLDQKCGPFPLDNQGNTPLHLAARRGHAKVVKVLLSCGDD